MPHYPHPRSNVLSPECPASADPPGNCPLVDRAQHPIRATTEARTIHAVSNPLPNELLTYIFGLACPPINFSEHSLCESEHDSFSDKDNLHYYYMPLTLSAVCRHWRNVASRSPEIRSTFAIEAFSWELSSQVPILRLYLTNTGPLPFSLDLDLRLQWYLHNGENVEDIFPSVQWKELQPFTDLIFFEFPDKIQTLRVAGAPPGWMALISEQRLPKLQDLRFALEGRMDYTTATTPEEAAASIHRLATSLLPPLTTIHLRNISIDICIDILLLCSRLTEYHCYYPEDVNDNSNSMSITKPFSIPSLKRFGWTPCTGGEQGKVLLRNIRLPNLEELQWCGSWECDITPEEEDVVSCFFSNLPKTLCSLTYYENFGHFLFSEGDRHHYRLLSHFPHAQSLVLSRCGSGFLDSIFQLLSNRIPGTRSPFLLPRLNKIIVRRYTNDGEDFGVQLVEMLKMRRSVLQIPSFTFEAVKSPISWSYDAREGLGELQDQFNLTLLEELREVTFAYLTKQELALFS